MRYYFIYIILIFRLSEVSSQTIKIDIKNLEQNNVQLSYMRSGNIIFIDSLLSTSHVFHYTFAKNTSHPGLYRISLSNKKWFNFIIDNEDVSLTTDVNNLIDSMDAGSSESNKLFYNFINLNKHYKIINGLLQVIPASYSHQYLQFVKITSQINRRSFVSGYIKTVKLPLEDVNLSGDNQISYQKAHYLDSIDFNNDDLLYSDAFNIVSAKYISLFRNPQMPKDLLNKDYISAVDTILNKAKVNQLVYQDVSGILIDKFRQLGFESVMDYIVDNYVIKDDLCLEESVPGSIQQRIDQSKSFKVGIEVPDLILPDSTGKNINLKDINSDKTLILFYASWCPHCQKLLHQINDLYQKQKEIKLKIFAVSLDTSKSEWLNFIRSNNYNWINVSELRGGYRKFLSDYKIYATPSMFLVNDKKELIAIPSDIDALKKYFN
jgi:thiol-disulfide isomerase/thioredoxin